MAAFQMKDPAAPGLGAGVIVRQVIKKIRNRGEISPARTSPGRLPDSRGI